MNGRRPGGKWDNIILNSQFSMLNDIFYLNTWVPWGPGIVNVLY